MVKFTKVYLNYNGEEFHLLKKKKMEIFIVFTLGERNTMEMFGKTEKATSF